MLRIAKIHFSRSNLIATARSACRGKPKPETRPARPLARLRAGIGEGVPAVHRSRQSNIRPRKRRPGVQPRNVSGSTATRMTAPRRTNGRERTAAVQPKRIRNVKAPRRGKNEKLLSVTIDAPHPPTSQNDVVLQGACTALARSGALEPTGLTTDQAPFENISEAGCKPGLRRQSCLLIEPRLPVRSGAAPATSSANA